MFEITFLGTGTSQGIPVIGCKCAVCTSNHPRDDRLRTAAMVRNEQTNIVIDVGPDFRQQMLRERVDNIDAVLLTHEHNDHVVGLDDVRPFNFMHRKDIELYGTQRVLGEVQRRFPYVFHSNPYPGAPQITLNEIKSFEELTIGDLKIMPLPVLHGDWPVMGFQIGPIVYITDAKYISEEVIDLIQNCDLLVLNTLRQKGHHSHFSLEEGIEMARKIQSRTTYFTHISHAMGRHEEVDKMLPEGIHLAYDGLRVQL